MKPKTKKPARPKKSSRWLAYVCIESFSYSASTEDGLDFVGHLARIRGDLIFARENLNPPPNARHFARAPWLDQPKGVLK